ncbi:MAG: hypothetical protein OXC82_07775 [Rhodobacteraceae bacterium]|nr:hypothetical protein [Paracoccaceae bacterium]MCY4250313.1 hypothetical protein [Paracoccaceae bacterium]
MTRKKTIANLSRVPPHAHQEVTSPRPCQGRPRHGQKTRTRPDPPP